MTDAISRWRTLLFVPAADDRKLAKAAASGADAVIVDLEDSVLESAKVDARAWLRDAVWQAGGPELAVRINGFQTPHWRDDLNAVTSRPDVAAILIPKAETGGLENLSAQHGLPPVIALIETASGVLDARAVAAHASVAAMMLGSVDLAAELRLELSADGPELLRARSELVLASAAAGLTAPIDGVWTAFADMEGLLREATAARRLGLGAKACIHPAQLPTVAGVFTPSEQQVTWARSVVAAAQAAKAGGGGATALNGEMIDRAVLLRAHEILGRSSRRP